MQLSKLSHHCALYGFFPEEVQYSSNKWIVDLLFSYGKVGVSIFVLITGYYMTEQGFRVSRALRIAGQVWFYSLCGLAVVMLIPDVSLEKMTLFNRSFRSSTVSIGLPALTCSLYFCLPQ